MAEAASARSGSGKGKGKRKKGGVAMECLSENANCVAPVVGYFPSGYDPQNSGPEPSIKVYRNKKRPNRVELVVSPNGAGVEFVGKSYAGEAAGAQICTYALGVLDKESQTLKIVPIAANKIFRLEPRLKADPFGETEDSEGLPQESIAANKVDRRMSDLTSLYGTKKAKDKDNKWKSLNEQRNDAAVNEHPESINANVEGKEVLEDAVESTYRNIPPYDPNADTPEKVYYLDEIIPKGERAYLLDILEDLRSGIDISTKCYPSFVYNRVHQLRKIQDQEEKETFACILSYISHLLNFWERHAHRRSKYDAHDKSTDNVKIPRIVYQKLLRTFLDSELNVLSTEKNNLLIGYILVLTLFADSFKTDPTDIARDLKMTIQSVKLYYQQLGCKTSRESASSPVLITLGIPLEFTYPERTKRRK